MNNSTTVIYLLVMSVAALLVFSLLHFARLDNLQEINNIQDQILDTIIETQAKQLEFNNLIIDKL